MSQSQGGLLPHNSSVGEIYRLNIAFIAVTSVIIGIRLIVRVFVVKHVAVDDYLMVAAGLFANAFSAMAIVGASRIRAPFLCGILESDDLQVSGMAWEDTSTTFHKT